MFAIYAQIRTVHIAAVVLSGALFLLRGLLVLTGRSRIAMWGPVRYATYGVDTTGPAREVRRELVGPWARQVRLRVLERRRDEPPSTLE